ncbi:triosephosphate isomerase [Syntrophus gentianae]|uniref:Triosephosphate isomerase n=1 Tax=Syntrophus gentianae TaxID=43775 RepID=A0A1H8B2Z6_9BACT|nr:triose-phosphate isomerase [Syntrophus gentianae]SEM76474.1 triosephosphate isomerase [Syntrophus gentianae]
MRKALIAGNWKMNKTDPEAVALAKALVAEVGQYDSCDILLCPPFTSLKSVGEVIKGSRIKLGAQTMHWEKSGAFTGMISADMLKALGCTYVIIGHSEQRQFFGETDDTVNRRTRAVLANGLLPIVCVGEFLEQREAGKHEEIVKNQVVNGLKGLSNEEMKNVVIAYEPVWAIGTGKTASSQDADDMHACIRSTVEKTWSRDVADGLVIQYGGSVKPETIDEQMSMPNIDGALVGGAALQADSFARIVKFQAK